MFKILDYNIVKRKKLQYLSFPDIVKSRKGRNKYFLVFRSADSHHPNYSYLHFLVSTDSCKTWVEERRFRLTLKEDGKVWNCPRLCYFPADGSLNIICDTKSSRNEITAKFRVYIIKTYNDGKSFLPIQLTAMQGMVPDKIVEFKGNLYCANHIRDISHNTLTQLINRSIDGGKTWYDCSILARSRFNFFCEASVVNYQDKYLIAYLRDNRRNYQNIYKYISYNGMEWKKWGKLKNIYGHRPTAILEPKNSRLFISYRNTKKISLSIMTCKLNNKGKEKEIEVIDIDKEIFENKYHFGYTGITKLNNNNYCVVYYFQGNHGVPFIKSCFIEYTNKD